MTANTDHDVIEDITTEATPTKKDGDYIDATVIGDETLIPEGFLNKKYPFMFGELHEKKGDRANTQDGGWDTVNLTWVEVATGKPRSGASAAWGLCRHPQAKKKFGSCIVFGGSADGARKAKAMTHLSALALDIDSGAKMQDVINTITEKNLLAFVYTSYNHGKSGLQLKRDDVLSKLCINSDPTLEQVKTYLREFSKSQYEEDFIAQVTIEDQRHQTSEGRVIALNTPPIDKFRVVFPLEEVVAISELAERDSVALDLIEAKITGLARTVLGVHFDTSCTDASRLYFLPRHPKDSAFKAYFIQGRPLTFAEVPEASKDTYNGKKRRQARAYVTPGGKSLNDWFHKTKTRFEMASLLESYAPLSTSVPLGVSVPCPFSHEHSGEGGETACVAINSNEGNEDCWSWFCSHNACQGRHKLEFVEEALVLGWFDEALLYDLEAQFLLPSEDGEGDDLIAESLGAITITRPSELDEAFTLHKDSTESEIGIFMHRVVMGGITVKLQERLTELCADNKVLSKTAAKKKLSGIIEEYEDRARRERINARYNSHSESREYIPTDQITAADIERNAEAAGYLPSQFEVIDGWFYYDRGAEKGGAVKVCRVIDVAYIAYAGETMRVTIRFPHRSKQLGIREFTFTPSDTTKDGIVGNLLDRGLEISAGADDCVIKLLRSLNTENEALLADHAGWNDDRTVFVTPTGEAVGVSDDQYVLRPDRTVNRAKQGDLQTHYNAASAALTGDNGVYFYPGYVTSFVGCLADFLEEENSPLLEYDGKSTAGKSTAVKAGTAHFAIPNSSGLFHGADTTTTAMENYALRGFGTVTALDEGGASKDDAREKQRRIFMMAENESRGRGTRDGGVQESKFWRTCFVSSSEVSFLREMDAADAATVTGAVARVLTVNVEGARNYIESDEADKTILDAYVVLTSAKKGVYGVTGPIFAQKVAEIGVEAVRAMVDAAVAGWKDLAKGASKRVVRVAALFEVAGVIAQKAEIFTSDVDVHSFMDTILRASIEARADHLDTGTQTMTKLRRAIRKGLQTKTIISIHDGRDYGSNEVLGYFGFTHANGKPMSSGEIVGKPASDRTYYLPLDRFVALGMVTDFKAVAMELRNAGALVERRKGDRTEWKWAVIPYSEEGEAPHIRVSGAWVHGDVDDDEGEATIVSGIAA